MTKVGLAAVAASALLMSSFSTAPARADGGATAAIILGTVVVATVACQPGAVVPAGQVLCLFSPFYWVGAVHAAPASGNIVVETKGKKSKSAKKSKSKKSKKG